MDCQAVTSPEEKTRAGEGAGVWEREGAALHGAASQEVPLEQSLRKGCACVCVSPSPCGSLPACLLLLSSKLRSLSYALH